MPKPRFDEGIGVLGTLQLILGQRIVDASAGSVISAIERQAGRESLGRVMTALPAKQTLKEAGRDRRTSTSP